MDKTTILLATATRTIEGLVRQSLDGLTHDLTVARSGSEAAVFIDARGFDLYILQAHLEGATGFQLCRKIQQLGDDAARPVIILSSDSESRSEARLCGSRAYLNIPFSKEELRGAVKKCLDTRRIILLVDDSQVIHRLTESMLDPAAFDLLHASDGVQALAMIRERRPDLIISDIEMPGMDGYAFCRAVKTDPSLADIPVLIQSSLTAGINIDRGFSAGADDYITKPVQAEELISRINVLAPITGMVRQETILVVDDSPVIRSLIAQGLRQQGFGAAFAVDGSDGLRRLAEGDPALIITDYEMPVMDGMTFVRQVRAMPRHRHTPVIMLSSHESRSDRAKGRMAGISEYLSKPFSTDKLLAAIERLIAESNLRREKEAMRLYVSDAVMERLEQAARPGGEGGLAMRAKEQTLTILFSDIVGFTSLCESLAPPEAIALLNGYFDLMVEVIEANTGVIDKFIGDAILALFPGTREGAYCSVKAAREMAAALGDYNERAGRRIRMRIGINTGRVMMGDLGSRRHRRDFTVIGDAVNLAQRLESEAPPDQILINDTTRALIGDLLAVDTLDPIRVKGRDALVVSHIVKSLAVRPQQRLEPPLRLPGIM